MPYNTPQDYPYYKNIKSPGQMGMSNKGTISTLSKDIKGLEEYVSLLVSGKSKASATGKPLGNKYFLNTGAQCETNDASANSVDRYLYINNVPSGNIPFIPSGMGMDFSELRGLIPGAMGNLGVLNPASLFTSFSAGGNPKCQQITMQTIDISNNISSEMQYVALADIRSMDPCWFSDKKNPVTGNRCSEGFQNEYSVSLPKDPLAQIYFACLACIGIYIFYRLMDKAR
jgi:hypothetical protein